MKLLPLSFLRILLPRPLGVDGDAAGGYSTAAAPAGFESVFTLAELDAALDRKIAAAMRALKAAVTGIEIDEMDKDVQFEREHFEVDQRIIAFFLCMSVRRLIGCFRILIDWNENKASNRVYQS